MGSSEHASLVLPVQELCMEADCANLALNCTKLGRFLVRLIRAEPVKLKPYEPQGHDNGQHDTHAETNHQAPKQNLEKEKLGHPTVSGSNKYSIPMFIGPKQRSASLVDAVTSSGVASLIGFV
jgi:hypothetical protein